MTVPTIRQPLSAWWFLVDLTAALTQPPADAAECDRRVAALASGSRLLQMLRLPVAWVRRASAGSVAVACGRRVSASLVPVGTADRVRAAATIVLVAMATTLVLRQAATEREPLAWMLPAAVGVVAAGSLAAADAIARAIANYRR
jgi:hypothetical protein